MVRSLSAGDTVQRPGRSGAFPRDVADIADVAAVEAQAARDIAEVPAVEVITDRGGAPDERGGREVRARPTDVDAGPTSTRPASSSPRSPRLVTAAAPEIGNQHARPLRDGLRSLQLAFREASAVPDAPGQGPGEKLTGAVS